MKTYLNHPMDYAKTPKLRFGVRGLDLPERARRHASSLEGKRMHICDLVAKLYSRTHVVGECEMYKKERDMLEEMRKVDECDMEEFGTLDSSENTIAIPGGRWWLQTAKQKGDKTIETLLCNIWKKRK